MKYILFLVFIPFFCFGQGKNPAILLKPMNYTVIETEFEINKRKREKNAKYNDSIVEINKLFYKSDYCVEKLLKYNKELKKYNDYEDSLVKVVHKFNLNADAFNYFLKIISTSCFREWLDNECNFYRIELEEKSYVVKVFKFGNEDGSSGNTFYKGE